MDFKGFYDKIIFDVDKPILRKYTGKQGDTKSRGLYVIVTQRNVVIKDLTGLSMRLFYEKPDKTRGFIDGVVDGDKFRIDYTNQMYAVSGVVWAELRLMGADGEVITSKAFKILVDNSIADGSIISKDERGILDRAFELVEDIIPRLELLDVELLEDVQNKMLQGQLKVAKVEKELNDYKATMQQINIHQNPTQKTSGHGIVSLPPNAAEGQVSGVVRGETLTNLADNGENNSNWVVNGSSIIVESGIKIIGGSPSSNVVLPVNAKPATVYTLIYTVREVTTDSQLILSSNSLTGRAILSLPKTIGRHSISLVSADTITYNQIRLQDNDSTLGTYIIIDDVMLLEGDYTDRNIPYINDTKSTVGAMRLKSVSADETETSTAYVVAKDDEGNIEELRSLPNGTKDEFRVSEGKLIQRIGHKENVASGTVINYTDMADGGQFVAYYEDGTQQAGVKGDTLTATATSLIYQLATPVEIPVQVSGTLVSYPSGTVYIEPFVADAGIYTDKMTVLHQDLPIKTLEKLSKIDFTTGLETELDVRDVVIAEDKLSFTHPDLVDGDIVFFTYEYDRESTEGETEIEYYDSRYVIKDSVTGKFYKWQITVADGVPSIELKEV